MMRLRQWLAHPLTHGLNLDDPQTTQLQRRIIIEKPLLLEVYKEWYTAITHMLPGGSGSVLELGSGPGFLSDYIPDLITSDIFRCDNIRVVLDGQFLPFPQNSLRSIVMTDVLHHLPVAKLFLSEAARCVRRDGALIMLEPWVTPWSKLIYTRFHHEPFRPDVAEWEFPSSGPLSGANDALPWIIFERDRTVLEHEFPQWHIETINLTMPLLYLVSGGVSMRNIMPASFLGVFRFLEKVLSPWNNKFAMFAFIVLRRTSFD
jgi:SAM-dependent methyltransferase